MMSRASVATRARSDRDQSRPAGFNEWRQRTTKRIDLSLLRWQARVESRSVDRFTPWVMAVVLFAALVSLALSRSRSLDAGTDLATYAQSLWLIGEGYKPISSLVDSNVLAENGSLVLYPLSVLTSLLPTVTTLLVVQSAALAIGIVPIWRLARRVTDLRWGATVTVVFAYAIYSGVHNINLADFHPEVVALPALLFGAFYGLTGRWVRFALMVAVVLSARADLGLAVAGLGILVAVEGSRRAGWTTAVVGLGWLLAAVFWWQPELAGGVDPYVGAFSDFGDGGPLDVLGGIVAHPLDFLGRLGSRDNFFTIVSLLAPVLFLPVVAPRYLLPAVPLYALYLAADVPVGELAEAQQTIPVTAFVFVATVFALRRSGTVRVERVNVDRRVLWALVLTASVFFVRDSASSPYEEPWWWGARDITDQARLAAIEVIPDDAAVRASPKLLPLLFERERLFELDTTGAEPDVDAAVDRVEWIIFDLTEAEHWEGNRALVFDVDLGRAGFLRVQTIEDVILVYQRTDE